MSNQSHHINAVSHADQQFAYRKMVVAILFVLLDPTAAFVCSPQNSLTYRPPICMEQDASSTSLFATPRQPSTLYFRDSSDIGDEVIEIDGFTTSNANNGKPSDFQSRMKRIAIQQQRPSSRQQSSAWTPENARTAVTLQEFADVIEEGRRKNKMVVVKFHASWCKKCLSLRPSFRKAIVSNPDVIFVDVPVTETNANLHQGLNVPSIPYGHMYHPDRGLVEETKLSRESFSEFLGLIDTHSSCSV